MVLPFALNLMAYSFLPRLLFALALLTVSNLSNFAQGLTIQVGTAAPPPQKIIARTDSWRFHKGTNAPVAIWKSSDDAALGSQWGAGSGGFGYADNTAETTLCSTILSDMLNRYTTIYTRKTFTISSPPDPAARLLLTIDYDDAFIAYLDGAEVARSSNAPGSVGVEPAYTANATSSHESSRGAAPVNPPATIDLGAVGNRLNPGPHVFAVLGLNQSSGSSDFILISELSITIPTAGATAGGPIAAIVDANSAELSGSNIVAGSTRVHVNAEPAKFDPATQTWSKTNALATGVNKLFIAALDDTGNLLASTSRLIVSKATSTEVGGALPDSAEWNSAMGVIVVTNTVVIPDGATLTIRDGVTVLVQPGANIIGTNATLTAAGTQTRPIYFLPADGTSTNWGGLIISGTNGVMNLQNVETIAGHIQLFDGAVGNLQDSYFHDYLVASPPIIHTLGVPNPVTLTLERCHIANYHEILSQVTTNRFSDSLLEYLDYSGDGIDFDYGLEGSYIRRCTVRRGTVFNTDAIDMGEYGVNGTRVTIDSCLLHDFIDKGISMGVAVNVTVTNTLIYNVDSGFGVKDNSVAGIFNCTVANANYGIRAYNKADGNALTGGGHVTNSFNNIFWNLTNNAVSLANGSTLVATYSDLQGTNYPGVGNINLDPLFVNAAIHDYRVQPGSPTLGAGLNGAKMGVTLPVGGIPATPLNLAAIVTGYEAPLLTWTDDSDNELEFLLQRSTDRSNWTMAAELPANTTQFHDVNAPHGQLVYYRVFALNGSGPSDFSNLASARRAIVIAGGSVGGAFTADTVFKSNSIINVSSTITVQNGATLFIEPGTRVLFNTGLELIINEGAKILAEGTAEAPIVFTRAGVSGAWSHLTILGSVGSPESKISYARFEFNAAASSQPAIELDGGTAILDHLTFGETTSPYMHLDRASFVVSNCEFPSCTLSTGFELVHGAGGIKPGGRGIIRHCFFGTTRNYNDVVDFTGGNRPGPIIQFYNNVFIGSGDDLLDLDGTDAWVEGNIFLHTHKNGSPDSSSTVSGGSDSGQTSEITVVGNLFFDCDQASTAKQGNFYTMINNTIVHMTNAGGTDTESAAIQVGEEGVAAGAGTYMEANVIIDVPELVRTYNPASSVVTFVTNVMSLPWSGPGGGNFLADPLLKHIPTVVEATFTNWAEAQIMWDWFTPQPGSPATKRDPRDIYKGGVKPIGISILDAPSGTTLANGATITVGFNRTGNGITTAGWPTGSGYSTYKWRLDSNAWSAEIPITSPIILTDLAPGEHRLEVVGKNDAGFFQNDLDLGEDATVTSATWTVDAGLRIATASLVAGEIHIHFTATAGATYSVQYKNDLNAPTWTKLTDVTPQSAGDYDVTDSTAAAETRFYRFVTPAQP